MARGRRQRGRAPLEARADRGAQGAAADAEKAGGQGSSRNRFSEPSLQAQLPIDAAKLDDALADPSHWLWEQWDKIGQLIKEQSKTDSECKLELIDMKLQAPSFVCALSTRF